MATLRQWLNEAGFDWEHGKIVLQSEGDSGSCPGWSPPTAARLMSPRDPQLDIEFNTGYGGPEAPRFIAQDATAIYFSAQYDDATWLERVWCDIALYLDWEHNTIPYPGC